MRRAILTLGSTAAALAALLSFKTHSSVAAVADPSAALPTVSASGAPMATVGSSSKPKAKASSAASRMNRMKMKVKATASAGASSGTSTAARTITGAAETTMYGPMQVKVTLVGQRITNVSVVQETNDGQESQQIDSFAIPKLNAETLAAQSARIDTVSGATTTSSGYIGSLQSALDQAA
jgi:uncharacterized protein with FMN-binding domain